MIGYTKKLAALLQYTNIKARPEKFSSFSILISFLLSLLVAFLIKIYFAIFYAILAFILTFFAVLIIFYFSLILQADKKASSVEAVLPDALQLMASNLRAGLTTDRALLYSAREEFGAFQDELSKAAREIGTGKSIEESLFGMTKRIKSDVLARTIELIVFGLRSGGELASLLEEAASNIRQQMLVQKQIRTNVMMYTILIFVALAFVSPILFSVSNVLVETLAETLSMVEVPKTMTAIPFTMSAVKIEPSFIFLFTLLSLILTTILGSFVLALIITGEERNGIKFMPFLLTISIIIFFSVRIFLSKALTAFF